MNIKVDYNKRSQRISFWKLKNFLKTKWFYVWRSYMLLCLEGLHVVTPCTITLFSDHMTMCHYTIFRPHDHVSLHCLSTAWLISMLLHLFPDAFALHVVTLFYDKLANLHAATPNSTILAKIYVNTPTSIIPFGYFLHCFTHLL